MYHNLGPAHLESAPIWTYNTLSSFDEPFLIPDEIPDFDDIASDTVIKDLDCLSHRDTSSKEFDHVPSFENNIGIKRFTRRSHRH
jgi:hypothetical protein